jgi:CheY-like chemotaxis protein
MRSIALRFESPSALNDSMTASRELRSATGPIGLSDSGTEESGARVEVADGEWVLARVELPDTRFAVAAAVARRASNGVFFSFGERDWERIGNLTLPPSSPGSHGARTSQSPSGFPRPPSSRPFMSAAAVPVMAIDDDEPPPQSLRTPGLRIALVDHEPATRAELDETLRAQGLDVIAFDSERAALAEHGPLHAAVVNFALPGDGAQTFARKMRESRPGGLPVLFVSEKHCSREIVKAYACGCDDYLARPFRGAELGARVLGLLRRSLDAYR